MEGLVVEPVEFSLATDVLFPAEDPDPQLERRLDLTLVERGADDQDLLGPSACWNAVSRSIGSGKTIVFEVLPISSSVCR